MASKKKLTSVVSKHTLFLVMTLFIAFIGVSSCLSRTNAYENRLKKFYQFLSPQAKKSFEQNDLKNVADSLEKKISKNKDLNKKWQSFKEKEAIDLFSTEQTVSFFYNHFYLKIKKSSSE